MHKNRSILTCYGRSAFLECHFDCQQADKDSSTLSDPERSENINQQFSTHTLALNISRQLVDDLYIYTIQKQLYEKIIIVEIQLAGEFHVASKIPLNSALLRPFYIWYLLNSIITQIYEKRDEFLIKLSKLEGKFHKIQPPNELYYL